MSGRRSAIFILATVALLALLLPPVAAYPESEAAQLHPDAEAAWHEPETVAPGTQWNGFLRLRADHAIVNASYQVCNLKDGVCFAPPTPADRLDERTFGFDTSNYLAGGRPVDYEAGWRIGIKWFLRDVAGNMTCLPGPCSTPDPTGGLEPHYLTFDMPAAAKTSIPAPGAATVAGILIVLAGLMRRGATHS